MLHDLALFLCAVVMHGLFRLRVEGHEHIPATGGFLLASNHVSYLDPVAIGVACRRRLRYMARHDLFHAPAARFILTNIRVYPVHRNSADFRALRQTVKYLRGGEAVLLFPEGARQTTSALGKPLAGAGFIAAKSGVQIVPAFVSGTREALPRGATRVHLNQVRVRFGKPIRIAKDSSYEEAASSIMQAIAALAC